ncbi:hypothetical protein C0J52_27735, partial [Blattella germanica]
PFATLILSFCKLYLANFVFYSLQQVNYIFERKSMKSVGITYRETCWIRNIIVESSTTQVNYIFERKSMKSVGITYRETCWIRNIIVESSTTVCLTIHNL